jgi:hypothetical protein
MINAIDDISLPSYSSINNQPSAIILCGENPRFACADLTPEPALHGMARGLISKGSGYYCFLAHKDYPKERCQEREFSGHYDPSSKHSRQYSSGATLLFP